MLARPELSDENQQLLEAADLIEKEGWWNGSYHQEGNFCLLQALAAVGSMRRKAGKRDYFNCKGRILDRRLRNITKTMYLNKWNDSHTKDEVLDLLREAAYGNLGR